MCSIDIHTFSGHVGQSMYRIGMAKRVNTWASGTATILYPAFFQQLSEVGVYSLIRDGGTVQLYKQVMLRICEAGQRHPVPAFNIVSEYILHGVMKNYYSLRLSCCGVYEYGAVLQVDVLVPD